ncbi:DUF2871 domain-containing protein [Corynebacterium sp. 335C]
MRKIFIAAAVYLGLGLFAGVFYREFTRAADALGSTTQLNTLHTHLLVLGVFFFLIVLCLERLFQLTAHTWFNGWFIFHNVALAWTIGMMAANGIVHVTGNADSWTAMWSGIAGIGHILLTVSFIMFFVMLGKRLKVAERGDRRAAAAAAGA